MNFIKYGYPKSFPEILSFLVTNKCVCRCKHCFNWHETGHGGAIGNTGKKDLTLDEIERIFKGFEPLEYVYIGGGEPFVRKDLFEILEVIYTQCRPKTLNISTNGQLGDNTIATAERFLTRCPASELVIKISIDAIGKEHDAMRQRRDAFREAIAVYRRLKDLKERFDHLDVGVNTVFSSLNQDKIFDIYNYLAQLSPEPDCMTQLLIRAHPREPESMQYLDIEKYRQWTNRYIEDMYKGRFEKDPLIQAGTALMYDYVYKTAKEKCRQIRCYAGIAGGFIDNEGMVGPCEHAQPYGSLRENDYNFRKIWHSETAEKMRSKSYRHCFCTNEPQWWHPSILYNKQLWLKAAA